MNRTGETVRKTGGWQTAGRWLGGAAIIGGTTVALFMPNKHNPPLDGSQPQAGGPAAGGADFGCRGIQTKALGQGRFRFQLQTFSHSGVHLNAGVDFGDTAPQSQTPQLPLADPARPFEHTYRQNPGHPTTRTVSAEIIDVNSVLNTGQAATCSTRVVVPAG